MNYRCSLGNATVLELDSHHPVATVIRIIVFISSAADRTPGSNRSSVSSSLARPDI